MGSKTSKPYPALPLRRPPRQSNNNNFARPLPVVPQQEPQRQQLEQQCQLLSVGDEEKRLIEEAIQAEIDTFEMPFCSESFYEISGSESDFFQLIVSSLPNSRTDENNNEELLKFTQDAINSNSGLLFEQTKNGCTLLHIFILHRQNVLTNLVLEYGARILQKDNLGRLPLHFAAASNNPEAITSLVNSAIGQTHWLNSPDMSGYTALHYAVENLALKTVRRLVELGANVVAQDDNGQTPLHVAAKQVDDQSPVLARMCLNKIIEILLAVSIENRLNPPLWQITQEDGLTAPGLARNTGCTQTAKFIEEKIDDLVSKAPSAPALTTSIISKLGAASSSRTQNECRICFSNEIDCLLEPCSHLTVCSECVQQITVCPICRAPIESTKKVYLS